MDDKNNLYADVVHNECFYGIEPFCYGYDVSIKDCLLCHRGRMNRARRDYLNFYKNVFLPWNNERKDGDADVESKKDAS